MKGRFLRFYAWLVKSWFLLKLGRLSGQFQKDGRIFLVDIDNTLADTWPTLKYYVYPGERYRYSSLPAFTGMRSYLQELLKDPSNRLIFLSARDPRYYGATKKWLASIGFGQPRAQLLLVYFPVHKILFIRWLLRKGFKVTYIDDLSYGHEHGEVKLYDNIINEILKLQLEFTGYEEVNRINTRRS